MNNRRVLYIFLVLLTVVAIVLLSSVLFSVKTVSLSFYGNVSQIDSERVKVKFDDIIGQNIFFINEKVITNEIEQENPYVRVIGIERVFPSSAVLHFGERKELFQIEIGEKYAQIDRFGKVLQITETPLDSVLLNFEYSEKNVGDFLTDKDMLDAAKLFDSFEMISEEGRNYDEALFKNYFKEIFKDSPHMLNIKTVFGAEICIENYETNLAEKIYQSLYILENNLNDEQRRTEKIYITQSN